MVKIVKHRFGHVSRLRYFIGSRDDRLSVVTVHYFLLLITNDILQFEVAEPGLSASSGGVADEIKYFFCKVHASTEMMKIEQHLLYWLIGAKS